MIKRLYNYSVYFINLPLYWLSYLIPKDGDLWIFGAWYGEKFADNPRYLFEYVNQYHQELKPIWLTKNSEVMHSLKDKGYIVYYMYSPRGLFYALRAKYAVFCQSAEVDLMPFINNINTFNIQLWHGIPFLKKKYSLMIASSQEDRKNFSTAFHLPVEIIKITGYPRNDLLFPSDNLQKNKIIYMPTFRDSLGEKFDLFESHDFDMIRLSSLLNIYNAEFYIKLHPVNIPDQNLIDKIESFNNIHFLENEEIYDKLNEFNMLITDYSSIYFDYLLTDHPIIFAPFDIDNYIQNDRDIYYQYEDVTPGPKCANWNEVMEWMEVFITDKKPYKDARLKAKYRFHTYHDRKNCERIMKTMLTL